MNINLAVKNTSDKTRGNEQRLRSACMHPCDLDAWLGRNQDIFVIGVVTCQSSRSITKGLSDGAPIVLVVYQG